MKVPPLKKNINKEALETKMLGAHKRYYRKKNPKSKKNIYIYMYIYIYICIHRGHVLSNYFLTVLLIYVIAYSM